MTEATAGWATTNCRAAALIGTVPVADLPVSPQMSNGFWTLVSVSKHVALVVGRPEDNGYVSLMAYRQGLVDRRLLRQGVPVGKDEAVEVALTYEPQKQVKGGEAGAHGAHDALGAQIRQRRETFVDCRLIVLVGDVVQQQDIHAVWRWRWRLSSKARITASRLKSKTAVRSGRFVR